MRTLRSTRLFKKTAAITLRHTYQQSWWVCEQMKGVDMDQLSNTVHVDLAEQSCVPCRKGTDPLAGIALVELIGQLSQGWRVANEHHLEKKFKFDNFIQALDFTYNLGKLAEKQGHHPDIYLSWGIVELKIWTHKINGLHESDFILAAKIDRIKI